MSRNNNSINRRMLITGISPCPYVCTHYSEPSNGQIMVLYDVTPKSLVYSIYCGNKATSSSISDAVTSCAPYFGYHSLVEYPDIFTRDFSSVMLATQRMTYPGSLST
jgi:hypothetical protein